MAAATVQAAIDDPYNGSATNQRKIARTSTGRLWVVYAQATSIYFEYSDDHGATWTQAATVLANARRPGIFIDLDDYLHVAYESTVNGYISYQRGTASGTDWTYSSAVQLVADTSSTPDLVAHREGTGWRVMVAFWIVGGGNSNLYLTQINITATGVMTAIAVPGSLQATVGAALPASIDFNHTGDGKTVRGGAPHLFVAWSNQVDSKIYFRKASYSAGAYTLGTVRTIDATNYAGNTTRISAAFDGTRVLIAYVPSGATTTVALVEVDSGDTVGTVRTPPVLSDGVVLGVSVSYDTFGEAYILALGTTSLDPKYTRYSRGPGTFSAWSATEAVVGTADSISLMRCSDTLVRGLYLTGASSPYAVRYSDVADTNQAPYAPAWVNTDLQAADVANSLVLDWDFLDPNTGDLQSAFALKRDIGGTVLWWNGTAFASAVEVFTTSGTSSLTLAASWGTDVDVTHKYYVATKDSGSTGALTGPYSSVLNVIPSAKDNPTITSAATELTATRTTTWTVATETAYRVRLITTSVVSDSGWKSSTSATSYTFPVTLDNLTGYTEEVTTMNDEGLTSTSITNNFTTAFVAPPTPTGSISNYLDIVTSLPVGLTVTIANPTNVAPEPDLSENYIYRREVLDTSTSFRIARYLGADETFDDLSVRSTIAYQYQIVAVGVNGAVSSSPWFSS